MSNFMNDTLFERGVWENISDVNRAGPIIHARKRTSLSDAVLLGISFHIMYHYKNNFLENFRNMIVIYNY